LLWKQEFRAAFAVLKRVLPSLDLEQYSQPVSIALLFLLATGQTAYMARLFEAEEFSVYRFRDRFKPFYYALLTALGQSRADDLKRMGPELADTVKEINERATSLQSEYFSDS